MKFLIAITFLAIAAKSIIAVEDIQSIQEGIDEESARLKKSYGAAPSHGYGVQSHGYGGQSHGYAAPAYAPSHASAYAPSHGSAYAPAYAPAHATAYAPAHAPAYAPAHAPAYAPAHAPAYAPAHAQAYAPAHAPAYAPAHAPAYGEALYSLGAPNPMFGAKEKDEQSTKPENRETAASEVDLVSAVPEESTYDIEAFRQKKSVYGGASHGGYDAPAPALHPGPATSYSYASHAPTVPCAKNLLLSCAPSVAPVPCAAPAYGHSSYGGHGAELGASKAY